MPIRRPQPAVIDEATLKLGLSLEALGLWAHIQMLPSNVFDIQRIETQFSNYDVGPILQELLGAGLLGEGDEGPPPDESPPSWEAMDDRDGRATIYVVQAGDAFKVGITGNLKNRIKAFKVSNANPVLLVWQQEFQSALRIEARMHRFLRRFNTSGEWFRCPREDIDAAIRDVIDLK